LDAAEYETEADWMKKVRRVASCPPQETIEAKDVPGARDLHTAANRNQAPKEFIQIMEWGNMCSIITYMY